MSTKSKKSGNDGTEKARKAALAVVQGNLARIEAAEANGAAMAPAGAPEGEVRAAAGSPVPPKAKGGKGAKAKAPKAVKASKAPKEKKPKKVSGLDAAAMVLASAKEPMNMKQVFAEIQAKKLWTTKGATPEATLYAAVIREIAAKGKDSRFKKHDRGLFTASKGA